MAIVTFTSDVGTGNSYTQILHLLLLILRTTFRPLTFFALLMFAKMLSKTFHRVAFTLYW